MFKPQTPKQRILHRLKISLGHLKKVLVMAENDAYCIDILHQTHAVQKALKEIDTLIMENHLRTCALNAITQGNHRKAISEVMQIFKKKGV